MDFAARCQGRVSRVSGDDEEHAARRVVMGIVDEANPSTLGRSYDVEVVAVPSALRPVTEDVAALDASATRMVVDVAQTLGRGAITARRA